MRLSGLCVFIFLFSFCTAFAQDFSKDYTPLQNYSKGKEHLSTFLKLYEEDAATIEITNSKARNEFNKRVKLHVRELKSTDSARLFMHTDTLTLFLNAIAGKIKNANSLLAQKNYHITTYRESSPNASNVGPQFILFNIGLLNRLENEAQVAFVICHEMAHEYYAHVWAGLKKWCVMSHDKELKKELKKIYKEEYGSVKKAEKLLLTYAANFLEHSRSNELLADSLGMIFYLNAGYDKKEAAKVMDVLSKADEPLYTQKIKFETVFENAELPFQKEWLGYDSTQVFWKPSEELWKVPDSLKTHPACEIRKDKIYSFSSMAETGVVGRESFEAFKYIADFEYINVLTQEEQFAAAVFYSLQLQEKFPENIYLKCTMVESLYEICEALKAHRFSFVVEMPGPEYHASYNSLLYFLHNMNSSLLKDITKAYINKNLLKNSGHPYIGYVFILVKSWELTPEKLQELIAEYEKQVPDKRYVNKLKLKFKPLKPQKK